MATAICPTCTQQFDCELGSPSECESCVGKRALDIAATPVRAIAPVECNGCGTRKPLSGNPPGEIFDTIVCVQNYLSRHEQGARGGCLRERLGELCPTCRGALEGYLSRAVRDFVASWPLAIVVACFVVALCVGCADTRTDSALQAIVECMTGPAQETVDEACEWVDVNDDGHVDLLDYYYLQRFWECAIPEGCGLGTVPGQ